MMEKTLFVKNKLHANCNRLLISFAIFITLWSCGRSYVQTITDSTSCCSVEESELEKFQHIRDLSHKFLILIGAQKSGSTLLFNVMASHPDTSPPLSKSKKRQKDYHISGMYKKEMHFFDSSMGKTFEDYIQFFNLSDLEGEKMLVEATPSYILHTYSACLIKQYLPNAKFILTIKEPAQRALSQCKMQGRFSEFHNIAPKLISGFKKQNCDLINKGWTDCFGCSAFTGNIISRGFYGPQLKNWLQFFKPEQFLVINHSETYDLQKTADKIFKFANLKPHKLERHEIIGLSGKSIPFSKETNQTLELLLDFYKPYNEYLYEILRNDFQMHDFKFE